MSTWAIYTIVLPKHVDRAALINALKEKGIPTVVYYMKPLHRQTAYKSYPQLGKGTCQFVQLLQTMC